MPTNLYNSIAEAWAANTALNALLPSTSIHHGRVENENAPYAVIETDSERKVSQTSKARWFEEQVTISVYADDLSIARQIQKLYRPVLDAESFKPTLDDGVCQSWDRIDGDRNTETGGVGKATDTYVLVKKTNRL